MAFIDEIKIHLKSGSGGAGCASFASDPKRPRGGPDGGDGGPGGHVLLRVNSRLSSLYHLRGRREMSAQNGQPGQGQNKTGAQGQDLIIEVPAGTLVKDERGHVLADVVSGEMELLKGGRGGKGNTHFKSSVNQAPTYAQPGEPGAEVKVLFQLKLIADVGIIGFPNAGKSTLISSLTSARPKIANYPFTTLEPQLGVVALDETTSFTMADIPGLIEGASEGVGLGHKFLRHIERTRVFIHLIDISEESQRDPWEDYLSINKELSHYDAQFSGSQDFVPLADRPQIVVFNKLDLTGMERFEDIKEVFARKGVEVMGLSALTHSNTKSLIRAISQILYGEPHA